MPTPEPPPCRAEGAGGAGRGARCDELGAIRGGTFRGEKTSLKPVGDVQPSPVNHWGVILSTYFDVLLKWGPAEEEVLRQIMMYKYLCCECNDGCGAATQRRQQ